MNEPATSVDETFLKEKGGIRVQIEHTGGGDCDDE
jgi:hypothetical protein